MKKLLILMVLAISGCDREPTKPVPQKTPFGPITQNPDGTPIKQEPQRFRVERQYTFRDRLAYGDERGVYLVTDLKTGQEFVGVSGIGVSELGERTETGRVGKFATTRHISTEQ